MSDNHRVTRRTRGIASAFAAVALSAVAVLASGLPANATGDGTANTQIPAGAVRSAHGPEAEGWHGPAFQPPGPRTRATGGTDVDISKYPGVVGVRAYYILRPDPNGPYEYYNLTCTGTILSPIKVLTAAHCAIGRPFGAMEVIAGRSTLDILGFGYSARVSSVWIHPGFNATDLSSVEKATPVDDVAVLTLATPLPAQYTPVTLTAQGNQDPYAESTPATVVGYGGTNVSIAGVGVLQENSVSLQSNATCQATHESFTGVTAYDSSRMACAGTPPEAPYANHSLGGCDGNSGGPLFVGSAQVGITTWSPAPECPLSFGFFQRLSNYNAVVKAEAARTAVPVNMDFGGDGHSDLMFRDNVTGQLGVIGGAGFLYAVDGLPTGGIAEVYQGWDPAVDWKAYKKLMRVTNWNGDGTESIFATTSNGNLYEVRTDGWGHYREASPKLIGTGWNAFADIVVTNNWFNDGRPNLMARTSSGVLKVYTSNGHGGWLNSHGTVIGSGWNMFNTVLTPGNWRGNGQSMIGRTFKGELRLYETNGSGGWINGHGTLIGTGWNSLPTFISPGDWNGDNLVDLVGISSTGDFRLYPTNGLGGWLYGRGVPMTGGVWPSMPGLTVF